MNSKSDREHNYTGRELIQLFRFTYHVHEQYAGGGVGQPMYNTFYFNDGSRLRDNLLRTTDKSLVTITTVPFYWCGSRIWVFWTGVNACLLVL